MGIVDVVWAAVILAAAGWILYRTVRRNKGVCTGCSGCAGCTCAKMGDQRKDGPIRLS
jgi:hypothetical protein